MEEVMQGPEEVMQGRFAVKNYVALVLQEVPRIEEIQVSPK